LSSLSGIHAIPAIRQHGTLQDLVFGLIVIADLVARRVAQDGPRQPIVGDMRGKARANSAACVPILLKARSLSQVSGTISTDLCRTPEHQHDGPCCHPCKSRPSAERSPFHLLVGSPCPTALLSRSIAWRALREMRFQMPVSPMAFFISKSVSSASRVARWVPS